MAIKLVAVDMDGTLLNEEKKVTSRTQRAVHDAIARGLDAEQLARPLRDDDLPLVADFDDAEKFPFWILQSHLYHLTLKV